MLVEIPDKTYFKIGEVARILGVKPHIVRYWESEFSQLRPSKTRSGQRLFRKKDIELLLTIRVLVHEHRYTVAGARERLQELAEAGVSPEDFLQSIGHSEPESIVETTREQLSLDGFEHDLREAMQRRIDALESELAQAHSSQTGGDALRRAATELRDERDQLREELAATQRELERATQVSLLDAQGAGGDDEENPLARTVEELEIQLREEGARVHALRAQVEAFAQLQDEHQQLTARCSELERSRDELRSALASSHDSLSTERLLTKETHLSLRRLQNEAQRQSALRQSLAESCERLASALARSRGEG